MELEALKKKVNQQKRRIERLKRNLMECEQVLSDTVRRYENDMDIIPISVSQAISNYYKNKGKKK